jgi:hypothetical protein
MGTKRLQNSSKVPNLWRKRFSSELRGVARQAWEKLLSTGYDEPDLFLSCQIFFGPESRLVLNLFRQFNDIQASRIEACADALRSLKVAARKLDRVSNIVAQSETHLTMRLKRDLFLRGQCPRLNIAALRTEIAIYLNVLKWHRDTETQKRPKHRLRKELVMARLALDFRDRGHLTYNEIARLVNASLSAHGETTQVHANSLRMLVQRYRPKFQGSVFSQ